MIYYGSTFSLGSRLQSEDRAHRTGQKKTVLIYDLIASNTIDELPLLLLESKQEMSSKLLGDKIRKLFL